MAEISLTSSMRNNLLSLQQTAKLQDLTQNRLATGLKVNSAIDNPSSYYTAQSLSNRAEDLNVLLDAMSQGIQTLKAVNESIETGTKFLEQAKSVANSALETAQPIIAKVNSEAELLAAISSGKQGLIVLNSDITMSTNQNIELRDGQSLVGARYLDQSATATKLTFKATESMNAVEIGSNSLVSDISIELIASLSSTSSVDSVNVLKVNGSGSKIDNIHVETDINASFMASVNGIEISNSDVTFGSVSVNIGTNKGTGMLLSTGIFGDQAKAEFKGKTTLNIEAAQSIKGIDVNGSLNFTQKAVFKSNSIVQASTINVSDQAKLFIQKGIHFANISLKNSAELNIFDGNILSSSWVNHVILEDQSRLNIMGGMEYAFDYINLNINSAQARVNTQSDSRVFHNVMISAVKGAEIMTPEGIFTAKDNITSSYIHGQNPGTGFVESGNYDPSLFPSPITSSNISGKSGANISINDKKTGQELTFQFNQILSQYDSLINDSFYKGVNLLKQQDLKVVFNESRSSDLEIKGVDATSKGLGLEQAAWADAGHIQNSLDQIDDAINQLRLMASEFGNYYQIVIAREDFTNSLINVLTEGADALTLADMNQESANMLALQTRQQLAVNSLSLASQASQSVLKLF